LIFKHEEKSENGDSNHVVHGLTTAASLWLSAAVGIACGGDLYMPASFGVAIMLLLLRFGPRADHEDGEEEDDHEEDEETSWEKNDDTGIETSLMNNVLTTESSEALNRSSRAVPQDYSTITSPIHATNDEMVSLISSLRGITQTERSFGNAAQKRKSVRKSQPALGSMV